LARAPGFGTKELHSHTKCIRWARRAQDAFPPDFLDRATGRPIYFAGRLIESDDVALVAADVAARYPALEILVGPGRWRDTAAWLRGWPSLVPSLGGMAVLSWPIGHPIGAGMLRELLDALHLGLPTLWLCCARPGLTWHRPVARFRVEPSRSPTSLASIARLVEDPAAPPLSPLIARRVRRAAAIVAEMNREGAV
jgi:hypothetical protein